MVRPRSLRDQFDDSYNINQKAKLSMYMSLYPNQTPSIPSLVLASKTHLYVHPYLFMYTLDSPLPKELKTII